MPTIVDALVGEALALAVLAGAAGAIFVATDPQVRTTRRLNRELRAIRRHRRAMAALSPRSAR